MSGLNENWREGYLRCYLVDGKKSSRNSTSRCIFLFFLILLVFGVYVGKDDQLVAQWVVNFLLNLWRSLTDFHFAYLTFFQLLICAHCLQFYSFIFFFFGAYLEPISFLFLSFQFKSITSQSVQPSFRFPKVTITPNFSFFPCDKSG